MSIDRLSSECRATKSQFTRKEAQLLAVLKANADRCLSREVLLRRVWGYQPGTHSRTVDEHILRLRRKLGPEERLRIKTVLGCGYMWSAAEI